MPKLSPPEVIHVPVLNNPNGCEYSSDGQHEAYLDGVEVYCRACGKKLGVLELPKEKL